MLKEAFVPDVTELNLVIALRRANYALLRTLRARRQQCERAWSDGWASAFVAADGCDLCEQERYLEPGTFTPHEHSDDR